MEGSLTSFFFSVENGHRRFLALTRGVSCWVVFLQGVLRVSFETADKPALQLLQKAADEAGLGGWQDRNDKGLTLRLKQRSRLRLVMRNGKMEQSWEQLPFQQMDRFVHLLRERGINAT